MDKATDRRSLSEDLIKSKRRVADHGEVFTPAWLVDAMLDLTEDSDRIEARFLEPACGNGNFLTRILQRKFAIVELKNKNSASDKKCLALISLMSIYGIDILQDNISECRGRLLELFATFLGLNRSDYLYVAASYVLSQNIIHGNALNMLAADGRPIMFAEWEYIGGDKFNRRDFRYDSLAQSQISQDDQLETISPAKIYTPMKINEIALNNKASALRKNA